MPNLNRKPIILENDAFTLKAISQIAFNNKEVKPVIQTTSGRLELVGVPDQDRWYKIPELHDLEKIKTLADKLRPASFAA